MKRLNRLSLTILIGSVCISALAAFAPGSDEVKVTHPYPGGVKADLWLVAGQSNMGGYATVKKETVPDPRIVFFSAAKDEDVWVVAKDPQERLMYPHGDAHGMVPDFTRLPVGGSGLVIPFAQYLRKYIDHDIGFIGVTTGQSMARVWDPALKDKKEQQLPNYIYARMIDRVKSAGGYGNLKGMIWYQGESDAIEFTKDLVNYKRILYNFIDSVRQDTGNPDLPIIIVQLSRFVPNRLPGFPAFSESKEPLEDGFKTYSRNWEQVREIQRQAARDKDNVYLVSTVDLYPMVDPIHLEYEAFQRLGPRIAEIALTEVYKLPGHATPIQLESVEMFKATHPSYANGEANDYVTIRVRFKGVNGRLTSNGMPWGFEIRYPEIPIDVARGSVPVIYRVDFDPKDPSALLLQCTGGLLDMPKGTGPVQLFYGPGQFPFCTIVDEKDIGIPAFGAYELARY
jgi:hypothetical protein